MWSQVCHVKQCFVYRHKKNSKQVLKQLFQFSQRGLWRLSSISSQAYSFDQHSTISICCEEPICSLPLHTATGSTPHCDSVAIIIQLSVCLLLSLHGKVRSELQYAANHCNSLEVQVTELHTIFQTFGPIIVNSKSKINSTLILSSVHSQII